MSDKSLVATYMAGGDVSIILNKMIQEGVDPSVVTKAVEALNKASALKEGHKSITDGEAVAIKCHGTIEQLKRNFAKKLMENGENDSIPLQDQKAKVFCMMNNNPELPLGKAPKAAEAKKLDGIALKLSQGMDR